MPLGFHASFYKKERGFGGDVDSAIATLLTVVYNCTCYGKSEGKNLSINVPSLSFYGRARRLWFYGTLAPKSPPADFVYNSVDKNE